MLNDVKTIKKEGEGFVSLAESICCNIYYRIYCSHYGYLHKINYPSRLGTGSSAQFSHSHSHEHHEEYASQCYDMSGVCALMHPATVLG